MEEEYDGVKRLKWHWQCTELGGEEGERCQEERYGVTWCMMPA